MIDYFPPSEGRSKGRVRISVRSRLHASTLLFGTALLTVLAPIVSPVLVRPAAALIVFDPTNYVQNVLTAARALQQINNQITALQNQAQMLVNQSRNLQSLPYSSLQQLQQSVTQTQTLLAEAQRIAYSVQQIDQAFSTNYGPASTTASDQALIATAQSRWQTSVAGLQDAMRVQAGVVGNIDTSRTQMSALVNQSQTATGALQATQAGNQLLSLQSQQLTDLTAIIAASGRSQALVQADQMAAVDQGREQRRRFLTPGTGYQPGNAQMFYGN
jgi:P-type conjugative transfer protein TrbJ